MATVRLDKRQIMREISGAVMEKMKKEVSRTAKTAVSEANRELLQSFLEHEITQEIANGPDGPSGTLDRGNLFSFLGFEDGSDPVGDLAKFLAKSIKISSILVDRENMRIKVSISLPSTEDMDGFADLPWVTRNWVEAIERGISGLGKYIYSEDGFESSRSTSGIEIEGKISPQSFKGRKYLTNIIKGISKKLIAEIAAKSV